MYTVPTIKIAKYVLDDIFQTQIQNPRMVGKHSRTEKDGAPPKKGIKGTPGAQTEMMEGVDEEIRGLVSAVDERGRESDDAERTSPRKKPRESAGGSASVRGGTARTEAILASAVIEKDKSLREQADEIAASRKQLREAQTPSKVDALPATPKNSSSARKKVK